MKRFDKNRRKKPMSTKTIKIICIVVVFVVVILATISWYSHTETVTGVVTSKWVESHTSCSNNSKSKGSSCTTTPVFLFQIQDGRVFDLPLGTLDFDRIQTGDKVSFVARGY